MSTRSSRSSRQSSRSSRKSNLSDGEQNADIRRIKSFKLSYSDQHRSPLFSLLPGEVRDMIYEYVFTDYEDLTTPYDFETCYRRPGYMGPRKTDTTLLRTCQAIYNAAWYMPWTYAQHTFFITTGNRRPNKVTEPAQMERVTKLIEKLHPGNSCQRKQVKSVQIFAQSYLLEPGAMLNCILQIPHFHPRHITITLRHTDIWWWESDHPIHINTQWVRRAKFPASTTRITIQLETQERRKAQVDFVAARAQAEWFFVRSDNIHLTNRSPPTAIRWTGSSSWQGARWIRDEDDREPGVLHYYIASVDFTPENPKTDIEGYAAREKQRENMPDTISVPPAISDKTRIASSMANASIRTSVLHAAGGSSEVPASEAFRMVQEYQARRAEAQRAQQHLAARAARAAMQRAGQALGLT